MCASPARAARRRGVRDRRAGRARRHDRQRLLVIVWLTLAVRSWRLIVPIVLTLFARPVRHDRVRRARRRHAEPDLGRLRHPVRRHRRRFRDPVQRPLPRDAARCPRFSDGAARRPRIASGRRSWSPPRRSPAGFFAFVPTDFRGVAELGLIAGTGMVIAFLATIMFLPAALTLFRPARRSTRRSDSAGADRSRRGLVRGAHAGAGGVRARSRVLGAALLPSLQFDSDPLHTKDPNTEAMRTLADLLEFAADQPVHASTSCARTRPRRRRAGRAARPAAAGADVLTLSSFVPDDQNGQARADRRRRQHPRANARPRRQPPRRSRRPISASPRRPRATQIDAGRAEAQARRSAGARSATT